MATKPTQLPLSASEAVDAVQHMAMAPKMLDTVCRLTGMRFAAIARVTEDRWTACAVLDHLDFGLTPGEDLVLDSTICDEIRNHLQPVVFGHASAHPIYSTHHTPRIYGLESYVSVPIVTEHGEFFGTLCAIDTEPRDFEQDTVLDTLTLFASLIAAQLALEVRASDAERALKAELDTGVLREQFLAVVGHDLRSPLQGARLAAEQLADMPLGERGQRLVRHLGTSVTRMAGLIDDIMDFARGRLGGGLPLDLRHRDDLSSVIAAAVEEVREGQPHCRIVLDTNEDVALHFDAQRLRQLLANLLNNAVAHGDPTKPVHVASHVRNDGVDIEVTNQGEPIAAATIGQLFEPFVRPASHIPRPGLGLGLYIASEIAKGHGATLAVTSDSVQGTTFRLRLPR